MFISETTGYKNSFKKIKKNYEAKEKLNIVLNHIEAVTDYNELKNHEVSRLYGFEELKDDLAGYCRFSIDKNGKNGKLRLIFSCSNESIKLEYISDEHYEDFKRYLRKV
ncbi:MAG: hypothetical protein E7170_04995 [Firmicutes bacterium]|nr:hypothetical protein [Bacillota bacterium]